MAYYNMEIRKRHEKDLKQVKTLLGDLRKAKLKCIELCEQLNKDLPNLEQYEILEVRCTRTTENMDKAGLINLQLELAKSLTELYEAERDLMYEAEKNSFKKIVTPPPPRRERQYLSKQELGPFKVPTYFNRPQPGINKIERISNFIQSIGKSMDSLRRSMQSEAPWDFKDFLTYEPEFLTIKRRVQSFKMRDEELVQMIQKKVEEEIARLVNEGQKVEEGDDQITLKIPKLKIDNFGQHKPEPRRERTHGHFIDPSQYQYHPLSMIEPKRIKSSSKIPALERINEEGNEANGAENLKEADETGKMDLHVTSFQKSSKQHQSRISKIADNSQMDYDENGNFVYMVKKVSPDSQMNSSIISSISSLRSLRKKVFDDDIWDEFQKL